VGYILRSGFRVVVELSCGEGFVLVDFRFVLVDLGFEVLDLGIEMLD
jgi:hypothetical protein